MMYDNICATIQHFIMKATYFLLASAILASPSFSASEPETGGKTITIPAGTVIKDTGKIEENSLFEVDDEGTLIAQPGLTVEKIKSTADGGAICLGEGAEATITGPATISEVKAVGSGGAVYMGANSKLTLSTKNAGEVIKMSDNEEDYNLKSEAGNPNDVYMEDGAELEADVAAGSQIILAGGVESVDTATLTKKGAGTLALGNTSWYESGDIIVEEGKLLLLEQELSANELTVQDGASIAFELAGSIVQTETLTLNGSLQFVYSSRWEEEADKLAALTLNAGAITIGETACVMLTLTDDVIQSIADGATFETRLIDTSNMNDGLTVTVQNLLTDMTVLNEQGEQVRGLYVRAEKGYVYITPEPATATLSLLGLSALCLRRRRV